MRTLTLYLATLVSVLGFATASQSAVMIDVQIGGSNTVLSSASATITAEFYISADSAGLITGYQFSVFWDSAELDYVTGSLNNAGPAGKGWAVVGGAGEAYLTSFTLPSSFNASTLDPGNQSILLADGLVFIGSMQFHVVGTIDDGVADVSVCIGCVGGAGDTITGFGNTLTPAFGNGLKVETIPEPTTASLLGLGLIGLTIAGRRRKS